MARDTSAWATTARTRQVAVVTRRSAHAWREERQTLGGGSSGAAPADAGVLMLIAATRPGIVVAAAICVVRGAMTANVHTIIVSQCGAPECGARESRLEPLQSCAVPDDDDAAVMSIALMAESPVAPFAAATCGHRSPAPSSDSCRATKARLAATERSTRCIPQCSPCRSDSSAVRGEARARCRWSCDGAWP